MKNRLHLKKGDVVLFAAVLLAGLLLLLPRGKNAATARVTVDGALRYEIDLAAVTSPYELPLENGVTLLVSPGSIRFLHAPCRGQDCVRCGALTRPGQAAVCIPTKTMAVITGAPPKGAPDAVSY